MSDRVLKLVFKAHTFEGQIIFEIFNFSFQGYYAVFRIIKCLPHEQGEICEVFIGIKRIVLHYELLYGIEAVENEVWVYLREQLLLFQFQLLLVGL